MAWGNSGERDDDSRSVASAATQRTQSTSGWGNVSVSNMPWGGANPAAKHAPTGGASPARDDDARSVASAATARTQSTTGWSSVDVNGMPWGTPSANNTSARGAGRGNVRGGREVNAWGDRGRGGGRGGRGGNSNTQNHGRAATPQTQPVRPQATWATPTMGEDDWGPPAQAADPW